MPRISQPALMSAHGRALHDLMTARGIDRRAVSELLGVSRTTVEAWLAPETSGRYRNCPAQMVELLDLKTAKK